MKKIIQKMITGLLSVTMLVAGVFSFGGLKKETASADTVIPAQSFTNANIEAFAFDMGMNMELYSQPSVFLADSELFINENIAQGVTYEDLETNSFLVGLSNALSGRIEEPEITRSVDTLTVAEIFEAVQMEVFVNVRNSNNYLQLSTGSLINIGSADGQNLMDVLDYDITFTPFYAAIVYPYSTGFYNVLYDLQTIHAYEVYVFPKRRLTLGDGGLVVWGWLGANSSTGDSTTGFRWSNGAGIG